MAGSLEILDLLERDVTYKGERFRPTRVVWDPETKTLTADFVPSEGEEQRLPPTDKPLG